MKIEVKIVLKIWKEAKQDKYKIGWKIQLFEVGKLNHVEKIG